VSGIAGWVQWDADLTTQKEVLTAMGETLAHRGPDDSGLWVSRHAGLVHRRLAVVDREGGAQPMVRQRGSAAFVLTYNDELYNAAELRRELASRGHVFHGHSDTEVVLAAYMEWGPDCLQRFNGMYAFGIWNEEEQQLFLARDRVGIKPLFYTQRGSMLLFGSELKALLAHPAVTPEVGLEGLAEIFVTMPMRTPGHGVFRGLRELKPAHYLLYDRRGLRLHQYWTLESQPHPDDFETTVARVRELLRAAVERRLVADVPICALLSGGIDSSTVTVLAIRALQAAGEGEGPLHTYSVHYTGNERYFRPSRFQPNDDNPCIELVTRALGTVHHKVVIDSEELVAGLAAAVRARDLPGMADIDVSLYLLAREIKRQGHTVALSGEAADEVFGGYPWLFDEQALFTAGFPWVRMLELRRRLLNPALAAKISPEEYMAARYREALAEVPRLEGESGAAARRREVMYLNFSRFGGSLLQRKDRMTAANGVEARVPYCDHQLIEYVWNVPWEFKTCDQRAKGLLRRAVQDLLPAEVVTRRKSPYPKTYNPAYLELVRQRLTAVLEDPQSPLHQLINVAEVRRLAAEADSLRLPFWGQLMTGPQLLAYLLQVDIWLRDYGVVIRDV